MEYVKFLPLGDMGITVEFGKDISPKTKSLVTAFQNRLNKLELNGILESVPTYRSISIYYNPNIIDYKTVSKYVKNIAFTLNCDENTSQITIEIPVWYSKESGMDLEHVAKYNNLTIEQVVKIHSSKTYLIYMLGFTPGFPYLGGMSEEIATPRLKSPRVKIDAGSVGIAGSQTGIYSLDSPGGWQLIGKTPVKLYNPEIENPILLKSGWNLKFKPISKEEYFEIKSLVDKNEYVCKTYEKEVL